ncbi:hypothetical protein KIN20_020558 [Parelaphostrongylus tenuis]|uniref:Bromodomain protein 4 C-terminal domain-containing protein n=1 Tax=Parelaphostrongylus tenuis TaxID=148309 RepID=A0AAD5N499_PARTN|nr:hypothetical protein KIN20_020558 [Parelaphostrongylus tenuis]
MGIGKSANAVSDSTNRNLHIASGRTAKVNNISMPPSAGSRASASHGVSNSTDSSVVGVSILDQLLPPEDSKQKTCISSASLSILDELLPICDTKSSTPSTSAGTTNRDQLLSSDNLAIRTPPSFGPPTSRCEHRGQTKSIKAQSPKSTLNLPGAEFIQPNHSVSIKAAEKLEQFKLQAKLKEEKRKQLRMDEEQRRRERDGQRAVGGMDQDRGRDCFLGVSHSDGSRPNSHSSGYSKDFVRDYHRLGISNDIQRESRHEGHHSMLKDDYHEENVHCENYQDSHHDGHRERKDQRDDYPSLQQPLESGESHQYVASDGGAPHVLTQEGAMLRRKEQERRMRELAKDVDLTSQMELMANFEASF